MPGQCRFKDSWLQDSAMSVWLKRASSQNEAYCSFCKKTFDISSMGKSALLSHSKGKKHLLLQTTHTVDKNSMDLYVCSSDSVKNKHDRPETEECSQNVIDRHVLKTDVLNAEIWWALKMVDSNNSFSSNRNVSFIFQKMFTDSQIAKQISVSETKSMYMLPTLVKCLKNG